jgi:hypothetical protein
MGLNHARMVDDSTSTGYDLGPAKHYDYTHGLMGYAELEPLRVSPLRYLGPVHELVLAKRFQ